MSADTQPDGDRGCPKCGHTEVDVGGIATTGGGVSKWFDIQTNRFQVVSCLNCGYSELYRQGTDTGSDLADVFLG